MENYANQFDEFDWGQFDIEYVRGLEEEDYDLTVEMVIAHYRNNFFEDFLPALKERRLKEIEKWKPEPPAEEEQQDGDEEKKDGEEGSEAKEGSENEEDPLQDSLE